MLMVDLDLQRERSAVVFSAFLKSRNRGIIRAEILNSYSHHHLHQGTLLCTKQNTSLINTTWAGAAHGTPGYQQRFQYALKDPARTLIHSRLASAACIHAPAGSSMAWSCSPPCLGHGMGKWQGAAKAMGDVCKTGRKLHQDRMGSR